MASRAPRSAGLVRSLTLLWVFAATSGLILAVAAFGLSSVLADCPPSTQLCVEVDELDARTYTKRVIDASND